MKALSIFCTALLLAAALVVSSGCFRQDIRTLVVKVPQMKGAGCSKLIQDAFARIDGVQTVEPDFAQHSVAVTYDARKLSIRNIEFVISGLGFDANDIGAKPEAKAALPAECR